MANSPVGLDAIEALDFLHEGDGLLEEEEGVNEDNLQVFVWGGQGCQ